jgi:hypothetical protein
MAIGSLVFKYCEARIRVDGGGVMFAVPLRPGLQPPRRISEDGNCKVLSKRGLGGPMLGSRMEEDEDVE